MRTEKRNENTNQVYPMLHSSTLNLSLNAERAFQTVGCGDFDVMKTPYDHAYSQAYEAAMQIIHGDLFPKHIKLPTVDQVAEIIMKECDLEWLQSIRLRASEAIAPNLLESMQNEIDNTRMERDAADKVIANLKSELATLRADY